MTSRTDPRWTESLSSLVLLTALALATSACAPHYLVRSSFIEATHDEPPAEITATAAYVRSLPAVRRIALRAPDACGNRTAAAQGGAAASAGQILQTNCGVEMAEIERAFSSAGYAVSSWDVVRSMVAQGQVTPLEAARSLGADVLFQVNSLERSTMDPGSSGLWERAFLESSSKGVAGEPAEVSRTLARELERVVVPAERELDPEPRLSATVNASAVLTATGDTIWYYQWTRVQPRSGERSFEVLVRCEDDRCKPMEARSKPEDARVAGVLGATFRAFGAGAPEERVSGSREAVTLEARPANRQDVAYHQLVREVVRDLVGQFAAEQQVGAR